MDEPPDNRWRSDGWRRLVRAAGHQLAGIRHGLRHDPAIRQVTAGCLILSAVALFLPVSRLEHLLLVLSLMLVVVVEFINSAVESCVDRISLDPHPLSGLAKDYASVAVGGAAVMSGLCWAVIAGPLLVERIARLVH